MNRDLFPALVLWLRNHYELGPKNVETKRLVLATVDSFLEGNEPTIDERTRLRALLEGTRAKILTPKKE